MRSTLNCDSNSWRIGLSCNKPINPPKKTWGVGERLQWGCGQIRGVEHLCVTYDSINNNTHGSRRASSIVFESIQCIASGSRDLRLRSEISFELARLKRTRFETANIETLFIQFLWDQNCSLWPKCWIISQTFWEHTKNARNLSTVHNNSINLVCYCGADLKLFSFSFNTFHFNLWTTFKVNLPRPLFYLKKCDTSQTAHRTKLWIYYIFSR